MDELERGEPRAAALSDITSMEDSDEQALHAVLDQAGHLRITKQRPKGRAPTTSEELRCKLRIEMH
eukprot:3726019-Amphidinium_carterae.1